MKPLVPVLLLAAGLATSASALTESPREAMRLRRDAQIAPYRRGVVRTRPVERVAATPTVQVAAAATAAAPQAPASVVPTTTTTMTTMTTTTTTTSPTAMPAPVAPKK